MGIYFTGIPPHWPTALTLFQKCGWNTTVHTKISQRHLVYEFVSVRWAGAVTFLQSKH